MPEHTNADADPALRRPVPTTKSESGDESAESDPRHAPNTENHQTKPEQSKPMTHPSTHEFQTDGDPGGLLFEQTVEDATAYFAVVLDTDDTSTTTSATADEAARDAVLEAAIRTVLATDGVATPPRIARELTEYSHDDDLPASETTITTLKRQLNGLIAGSESDTSRAGWPDAHDHRGIPSASHPTGGD